MSTQSVNSVTSSGRNNKDIKPARPSQIIVKPGESLPVIAKRFGMNTKEFMEWTGLKKANLNAGQKINLPTSEVPEGKGILALARKYNMTLEEFGDLNNLPKPYKDYSAQKGERFYVKRNSVKISKEKTTPKTTPKSKAVKKSAIKTQVHNSAVAAGAKIGADAVNTVIKRQQKWGSSFTPQEIAAKLEKEAYDNWGAVGKKSFDDMLQQINPKNASAVIKAYDDAKYGQSLINRITHEVTSSKTNRKKAVMYVYDSLAKEKNIPQSVREEFEKELNDRFDDWGMVNTKRMDEIINKIISGEIKGVKSSTAKHNIKNNSTKVHLTKNNKVFTVSELQNGAIHSAKKEALEKFKEFCIDNNIKYNEENLDMGPLERIPAPNVQNGVITAQKTAVLPANGKPNGKIVILNPGHGGYSSRTGYFDPGSYSFIKKGNGKYAPLLEYEKMKIYSESLAEKLRDQGYAVVITSAHAQTLSDQKSISKLIQNLNTGKNGYNKNNIMFISLHADSEPGKSGSGVCYDSRFAQDTKLTDNIINNLNQDDWIKAVSSERNWDVPKKGLQVLHQTENIPSVLIEVEYVNGAKSRNLDSSAFQNRFEKRLIDSINTYFHE